MLNQKVIDAARRLEVYHCLDAKHEYDCFIVAQEYLRLLRAAQALYNRGYVDQPTQRFIVPLEFVESLKVKNENIR